MTHPTADAIAALTAVILADEPPQSTAANYYELRAAALARAREVRSALLSAQGQAGKPVAWRVKIGDSDIWDFAESEEGANWQVTHSGPRGVVEPLYVQPQPAAGVTDARALAINATAVAKILEGNWPDVLTIRQAAAHLRELAAIINPSALDTIKGLET